MHGLPSEGPEMGRNRSRNEIQRGFLIMDKILIADGDASFLRTIRAGLEKVSQFTILTAASGDEAVSILEKERISVFVTDMETPGLEIPDLLAHMTRNCPNTPCIIMTDWGKPWFGERLAQQSLLYHIEKPFEIGALVSAVFVGLNLRDEGIHFRGMTMMSILPLMELYQKTCRLKVSATGKGRGYLYFREGALFDAHLAEKNGEEAALEIATWDKITFELSELPRHRTRKRVKTRLMDMAGFSWIKNQAEADETGVVRNDQGPEGGKTDPEKMMNTAETLLDQAFEKEIEDMFGFEDETEADEPGETDIQADTRKGFPDTPLPVETTAGVYTAIINEIRKIASFRAVAIATPEAEIKACDQADDSLALVPLVSEMARLFRQGRESAKRCGGMPPETITIQAEDALHILHRLVPASGDEILIIITAFSYPGFLPVREKLLQQLAGFT